MNIKKAFLVLCRLCSNKNYRFLRRLKVFDSGYYLSLKGLGSEDDLDPLWTYVTTGEACTHPLGRDGSIWSRQADPHPLFDTSYYVSHYFPDGLTENPFIHYLRLGWKKGYRPGPFLDPVIYGKRCGWVVGDGDPLTHYTHHGQQQEKSPSLYFDFDYYFDNNPILAGVGREIIKHYKLHGAPIGKTPLPVFEPQFYLQQLGVEAGVISDPLAHYLSTADTTTHLPGRLFDPDFYLKECGLELTRGEALGHYLTQGLFAGIYCHKRVASLGATPLISLVVPVYNPDPAVLRNCIRSVLYQAYPHWQLCLVDDCSSREDVRPLLEEWAGKDSRIKVSYLTENSGIATATNSAAALASGEYIGFLDNDDELTLDCLLEVVEAINDRRADMVYSDEDLIGDDGTRLAVFRKPDVNMGLLLSHNYITHFVTVKRALFEKVGGLELRYDGAQDYDLMLKLSEVCENIVHIAKVLYHWRASESSTSINHNRKNYANEAGRQALAAAVARRGLPYMVSNTELNFYYRLGVNQRVDTGCTVLIWVAAGERLDRALPQSLVAGCRSVESAEVEYIVVTEENNRAAVAGVLADFEPTDLQIVTRGKSEAKAQLLHRLVSHLDGKFVVLLSGSVREVSANWLAELSSQFVQPDVAMVCGKTTYNGQDGVSYLLPDTTNKSAAYLQEFLSFSTRHMAGLHCLQDISFGGWDLTMFRRKAYLAAGGFLFAEFPQVFAVADLSMRFVEAGKRIVYTPFASCDKESLPVLNCTDELEEMQEEKQRFQSVLRMRKISVDPFYNSGLLADNGIDENIYLQWLQGGR